MIVIGIDPGPSSSAVLAWNPHTSRIVDMLTADNETILNSCHDWHYKEREICGIEMVASYGMAVGRETFETVYWIGRFAERWDRHHVMQTTRLYRRQDGDEGIPAIVLHLCHDSRAKDANIRQALRDRFGPKGTKKHPGILYGIKDHAWSALAVAVTLADWLEA
jgi:hypothetical protein